MDRDEVITQAIQVIADITKTLDMMQAAAEDLMDTIAAERSALETVGLFCTQESPNGDKSVESVEHAFYKRPETVGALGFAGKREE